MADPLRISSDFGNTYRDLMIQDLAQESQITKRVIGRIPEDKRDYKPHPTSRSAWDLARHITTVDVWFLEGIANRDFNGPEPAPSVNTVAELLRWYEGTFANAANRVRAISATDLAAPLDFLHVANLPAVMYLNFAKNHAIHHRGQLSAYLRPMGATVPDIYGGSADEPAGH